MRYDGSSMMRLALAAGVLLAAVSAASAQDVRGTWLSQSGETRVRVAPCGGALCGTIVWTKDGGKDTNNANAALRERNLVGVQMISDIRPSGAAGEYSGQLYNYRDGKTYAGKMKLNGVTMDLSGCVAGGLICRSQSWTRVN